MASVGTIVNEWLERADHRVLWAGYRAASVRVARLREELREQHAAFVDPRAATGDRAEGRPVLADIDRTARRILRSAAEEAGRRSGIAGLVGAISLPTEVVVNTIGALRLAQRLCVVYGFDPHSDRGRMALCQALAAAYDVDLPDTGPEGFRATELVALARERSLPASASARLTRAMTRWTARFALTTRRRWIPVVGAPRQALLARQRTLADGEQMIAVLRRLSEVPGSTRDRLEDAIEVAER